ncbi:MAG: division/cell wall cluster transcriptional repressor MraZ [Thermodesulfobacteriota bacterium]|nr:division/cell wall cluster transcriptional repressor MraZ [Thermodesulfobacteriota bacterium]
MSFSGTFFNSIDPKGRLSIPAKLRSVLADTFGDELLVVTRRKDALVAYPLSEWERTKARVDAMPNGDAKDLIYRSRISPAVECGFDRQGRIALPVSLRTIAKFDKEIVIVAMAGKIELWSQCMFEEQLEVSEQQLDTMKAELGNLGF